MCIKHRDKTAICDLYKYVSEKYGKGWTESACGSVEGKVETFLLRDLEYGKQNCTLAAITRLFAFHRDNSGKKDIPESNKLYGDIKEIAKVFGYSGDKGTNPTKINNIINYLLLKYGYAGKGFSTYIWDFKTVKREIDKGKPLILNIAFGYYRDHSVSVVGYSEFTKGKGVFKRTKKFIKVYDGWTNLNRFVDYSRINIASFSAVKFD